MYIEINWVVLMVKLMGCYNHLNGLPENNPKNWIILTIFLQCHCIPMQAILALVVSRPSIYTHVIFFHLYANVAVYANNNS